MQWVWVKEGIEEMIAAAGILIEIVIAAVAVEGKVAAAVELTVAVVEDKVVEARAAEDKLTIDN
jgi:hypothetical protein